MCDPILVFAILEVLTLLQRACENEHIDEVRITTTSGASHLLCGIVQSCLRVPFRQKWHYFAADG